MPAPLVLLPGLMCDSRIWKSQFGALADADPWSPHGYGDADSIMLMAQYALNRAPRNFSLAGHSMGARVALEVVRLAPHRVERLALLDTGVHPPKEGEAEKRLDLLNIAREEGMDAFIEHWLPPMVHPDRRGDAEFMRPLREMIRDAGVDTYERQMRALLERPETDDVISSIRVPTLIGVGREDEWSPVAQHEEIVSRIPGSRLVIFEHCGHMAPVEAPDAVNQSLQEWLSA